MTSRNEQPRDYQARDPRIGIHTTELGSVVVDTEIVFGEIPDPRSKALLEEAERDGAIVAAEDRQKF